MLELQEIVNLMARKCSAAVWVILNIFRLFFSSTRKIDYFFRRRKKYRDIFRRWLFGKCFFSPSKKIVNHFSRRRENAALLRRHVDDVPQSDFRRTNRSISPKPGNIDSWKFVSVCKTRLCIMSQNLKVLRLETTVLDTPEVDANCKTSHSVYQPKFLSIFLAGEKNDRLFFSPARKTTAKMKLGEKFFSSAKKIATKKMWRKK